MEKNVMYVIIAILGILLLSKSTTLTETVVTNEYFIEAEDTIEDIIDESEDEPETISCTDSDGGNDVFQRGTCTDADGTEQDSCPLGNFGDFVSESYCDGDTCAGASYSCVALGGLCYASECILHETDSDNDGWSDLDELQYGTDPNNSQDYPQQEPDDTMCDDPCMMEQLPFGGRIVMDPMQCQEPFEIAIPGPPPYICCCWFGPPI